MASACLDDATIARLAHGEVEEAERREILAHADGCEDCRALLVALARPSPPSDERTEVTQDQTILASDAVGRAIAHPEPGDVIDHYTVVDVLGSGAMGLVVRARDSELGRDVALKLLINVSIRLPPSVHVGSDDAERRLVREAQAMAQLSHPNVVTVHAVGRYRGGVYIAMELVVGQTLRQWCDAQTRSWEEIVRAFVQAGEGLAAAHAADLVHRDFKPDNVLVRDDGRVLVSDFGLAGVAETFSSVESPDSLELGTNLTRTGAVMGTPRFMAPEQHEGRRDVDARADQFAFGVALYHALYGCYPFEGKSMAALRLSVSSGIVRRPPVRVDVPRAVWRALQRCIEPEPEDRYPDMRAVLRDLRRVLDAPGRRRRMIVLGGIGTAMLGGGLALGLGLGDLGSPQPCATIEQRLGGIWSEDRAQELEQKLRSARDVEAGSQTATLLRARLDDYALQWTADARETCEATHVHGVQPLEQLQAHSRCLDERRIALDALVTQLITRPADEVIERAVSAAAALPGVAACRERRPGLAAVPPEVETQLARLRSLLLLGAYDDVEREAAALDTWLEEPRARARMLVTRGRARSWHKPDPEAVDLFKEASFAAAEAGDDFLIAVAQIELVSAQALGQGRYREAELLVDAARVAVRRVGDPVRLRRRLATFHATVLLARESFAAAMEQLDVALAAVDEEGGDELARARVLQHRATALAALGREDEALDDATFVLEARRRALGSHHPTVAEAQQSLARVLLISGRRRDAEVHLVEALAGIERHGGPHAMAAAEVLMMLAGAVIERDPTQAVRHAERSLEILGHHGQGGSQHAYSVRNMIGWSYSLQGRHQEALRIFTETIEAREQVGGVDQPAFASDLELYANALVRAERCADAIPVFRRMAKITGEGSPYLGPNLVTEAICQLEFDLAAAQRLLERALELHQTVPLDDLERARALFGLARVHWAQGKSAEALERAQAGLALAPVDSGAELRAEIEAWLQEHRPG
ncbi:MAG: serine/threonine-protein kinase [Myxococcota bacterium]